MLMFHFGLYVTGVLYLRCDPRSEKKRASHEATRAPSGVAVSDRGQFFIVLLAQLDLLKVGNDTI